MFNAAEPEGKNERTQRNSIGETIRIGFWVGLLIGFLGSDAPAGTSFFATLRYAGRTVLLGIGCGLLGALTCLAALKVTGRLRTTSND